VKRLFIFLKQKNEMYPSDSICGCIDRMLCMGRAEKTLLALQDKESLLRYLADIPVGLMPKVLAFSQRDGYLIQQINLSIVYSTMRWWNMPTLYSSYCCVKTDAKRKRDI
jgi:hypothetical protein